VNVYEVRLIGSDDFEPTAQPINIPYGDWLILHEAEKPLAGYAYAINHIVLQIIWPPTRSQDERVHTLSYELT
jgi:hypothetical protein